MRILEQNDLLVVLRLMSAKGIGVRTLSRILDYCLARGATPAEIACLPADEFATQLHLSPEAIQTFRASEDAANQLWQELSEHAVHILVRG